MRLAFFIIILLIAASFYSFSFGWGPRLKEDILRDKLIKKVGEELSKKFNIRLEGIGGGSKGGKIRQMSITFGRYGEPLNIEQSRKIIIDCVQAYLDEINSNKEIQPYLLNRPFTAENLDISILNFYPNGSRVLNPHIGDITEIKGILYYRTSSGFSCQELFDSEFKETYDEALAKVKQKPIIQEEQNFTIFPANS